MQKKVAIIIMFFLIIVNLCACTTKYTDISKSQANFQIFEEKIEKIAKKYGFKLMIEENKIDEDCLFVDFAISINSNAIIKIRIINTLIDTNKGLETFSVDYNIDNFKAYSNFDTNLFVDLVNAISEKTISYEFCNEFLTAPESKYAAQNYGYKKTNDEIVSKRHEFNFAGDWSISYILDKNHNGMLTFGGLTKSNKKS